MCNKKIRNKFLTCVGLMLCVVAVLTTPAATLTVSAAESTDVETCADFKEWIFKIDNGKMYKALFNNTTGQLETDWIYVCDWPEGAA